MKIEIFTCDSHDHVVVYIDGEEVISNDYSIENVRRIAEHLGWEEIITKLTDEEFENRFA